MAIQVACDHVHARACRDPMFAEHTMRRLPKETCAHPFDCCSFFDLKHGGELVHCARCGGLWTSVAREWTLPETATKAVSSGAT
jgi:hypothetical protein